MLQAVLLAVVMLCGIGVQLAKGYTGIDLPHYLFELFVLQLAGFLLIGALALFVHTLVDHKYVGHFAVLLAFLAVTQLPDFGFEDRLYRYASRPDIVYSDMNGYGHFLPAVLWFRLYWGAFAVLLLLATYALWARGRERGARARLAAAAARWTPVPRAIAGAAAALFVATGGFIYYNTHVLNPYVTRHDADAQRAAYERDFRHLAGAPQPTVAAVDLAVDLVPAARSARVAGSMRLENRSAVPIVDLYVHYPRSAQVHAFDFGVPARLAAARPEVMWHHYVLAEPLPPGGALRLRFDLGYEARGFRNDGRRPAGARQRHVPQRGSRAGADAGADVRLRPGAGARRRPRAKKAGPRAAAADARSRRHRAAREERADPRRRLDRLSRDRVHGRRPAAGHLGLRGRRPDRGRSALRHLPDGHADGRDLSVRLGPLRAAARRLEGPGGDVAIEIDYHPGHEYNLDRMVAGVKDSLAYFTAHFGPYQHRIVRIIEFPRFRRSGGLAASFPNTVPFNEAIGFTARVDDRDPTDVDYPYFVTAHEVAHQWWAHQVVPANVQGAEFVTESLAEYSALMVLKQKYGDARMRRFLKYELDRYLAGRGTEQKGEQPLLRADGADYVHYQKGALALYALQDAIGEAAIDDALAAFVARWRFQGPPYATSRDLVAELRRVTPAAQQGLVEDLFEAITLYDLRTLRAEARPRPGGGFDVELVVAARKVRADGEGNEREAPLDARVDVGVQDAAGNWLLLDKRRVVTGENRFTLAVDGTPARAGIDPLNKLIDRDVGDNVGAVAAP